MIEKTFTNTLSQHTKQQKILNNVTVKLSRTRNLENFYSTIPMSRRQVPTRPTCQDVPTDLFPVFTLRLTQVLLERLRTPSPWKKLTIFPYNEKDLSSESPIV